MSSHREAPEISQDPVADNTDLYAFVSPDNPETVTIIANYIPLQGPAGGPNFYSFGDDVLYEIHISNSGTAGSDIIYQFRFTTQIQNPNTFLYNTGPITSLTDSTFNKRQVYTVSEVKGGRASTLGSDLATPPCNIGPHSTPSYPALAQAAIHTLGGGMKVFAGQRADEFYVDLGAVFDLLDLRPFQNLIAIDPMPATPGIDTLQGLNVHTIAIQVPKSALTKDGSDPTDPSSATSVIGVYASASRQQARMYDHQAGQIVNSGTFVQVSRLGNPLFNEVLVPLGKKDFWNSQPPASDSQFAAGVEHPEVAALLPTLYPGAFPHLAALSAKGTARADLAAVLLTGLPSGIVPGFQNNTGTTQADLLRLNMAIPPTAAPNNLGLLGSDAAGFPNGRRVMDDVVTIELRALAGVTYALVDKSYTPDAAATKVTQGVTNTNIPPLASFPYLGTPNSGFDVTPGSANAGAGAALPSGAPATGGGGTAGIQDRGVLIGGAALAGAAVAAGVAATRSPHPATANGPAAGGPEGSPAGQP